jgi:hypothetical protein
VVRFSTCRRQNARAASLGSNRRLASITQDEMDASTLRTHAWFCAQVRTATT